MTLEFLPITNFSRGILCQQLEEAYSFDSRWKACFGHDWREYDDFFFDHPDIAEHCGFITALGGEPIGHISWDPRNRPAYVILGHNCIVPSYKGRGYGKRQLREAVRRIRQYEGLQKIIVCTNSGLVAPRNYESVGFQLCQKRKNDDASAFSGDYLDYELLL